MTNMNDDLAEQTALALTGGRDLPVVDSEVFYTVKYPVYLWNKDEVKRMSEGERQIVYQILMCCQQSGDRNIKKWVTYVLSFMGLCYPKMDEVIRKGKDYNITELSVTTVKQLHKDAKKYLGTVQSGITDPAILSPESDAVNLPNLPTRTNAGGVFMFPIELFACKSPEVIFGLGGICIYLIGKRITTVNEVALVQSRPGSLLARYSVTDERYVLTGEGRIGSTARIMIDRVWQTQPVVKRETVGMIPSMREMRTVAGNSTYMIAKLLRWSRMSFVELIMLMVIDQSWVVTLSYLRAALVHWRLSIAELNKVEHREMRPYKKLMDDETFPFFDRKKLGPLISCAIVYNLPSKHTLARYQRPDDFDITAPRFCADLRERANIDIDIVALLKDLEESV